MAESSLIFISGGVRSGKSSFAEKLAADYAQEIDGQLHYIAAGQSSDPEMEERIRRHQNDRLESGLNWTTWEQPVELTKLRHTFQSKDIVLLDCLTTLLNNEFFSQDEMWKSPDFQKQVMASIMEGIEQIAQKCHHFIIVSNEVVYEPLGDRELVYIYGKMLAQLHRNIVAKAYQAFLVEAGIPLLMKGIERA
ncbi:bifunctional adenosylcobinamide kinase/adenosylcobinamide-phosphate guanylyltransferase [Bacillus sp. FJAT-49705]|uniref:Adenosylcobinamide kinase n=1 Tax=Cytobacillus citreus TaxID=2833586 RepID=A0ABS5NXL5_9BACI|nr:bifunctional adenosylcobinamide kinase/adenosylcobinamide-phosphate guanylyltransferase [Cytobacillus citreus]MBS4192547.1 bifunctional adenosylcobinamide kinase/adenosylcobinamide-phosphate guanylyltransferase [Cytobacillus citreus]